MSSSAQPIVLGARGDRRDSRAYALGPPRPERQRRLAGAKAGRRVGGAWLPQVWLAAAAAAYPPTAGAEVGQYGRPGLVRNRRRQPESGESSLMYDHVLCVLAVLTGDARGVGLYSKSTGALVVTRAARHSAHRVFVCVCGCECNKHLTLLLCDAACCSPMSATNLAAWPGCILAARARSSSAAAGRVRMKSMSSHL